MPRLVIRLAALSATAILVATAPAFARGGGFGHSSFSSMGSHANFGAFSHDTKIHASEFKSTSHADERRSHRVRDTDTLERKVKHLDHEQKVEHTRRELEHYKANKIESKQTSLVKKIALAHKLTDQQFARAKLVDSKGRFYDAKKKGWTDGKGHWWYGRFAWLFIDGDWYYGDQRWAFADGNWSCEDEVRLACDNCKPVQSTNSAVAVATPASPSTPAVTTATPAETAKGSSDQPGVVKQAALSTDPVAVKAAVNRVQPTSSTVTTNEMPSIEAATSTATLPVADTPVVVDQSDSPIECKRFLPNYSLTITIPCSQ